MQLEKLLKLSPDDLVSSILTVDVINALYIYNHSLQSPTTPAKGSCLGNKQKYLVKQILLEMVFNKAVALGRSIEAKHTSVSINWKRRHVWVVAMPAVWCSSSSSHCQSKAHAT